MMLAATTCMVPRVGCAIPPPAAEPRACGSPLPARFISSRTRTSTRIATMTGVASERITIHMTADAPGKR